MISLLDILVNTWFLVIGIIIGYFLNKEKIKQRSIDIKNRLEAIFIKPDGSVIDSKEENSLNKLEDEVNYHHNNHYDESNEPIR